MNLVAARRLKQQIRAALAPLPFAVGIRLTTAPHRYRVSVLLEREGDRQSPRVRRVIETFRDDVDLDVIGESRAAGSAMVDVRGTGPLRIGASVGHRDGGVGSLGFFAARRSDGRRGFVSCNHVIAMADEGRDGDAVVSPSTLDGPARIVATLDGRYPRLAAPGAPADCAFAALIDGVDYDASSLDGGTLALEPAPIAHDLMVTKVGKVTGARAGVVQMIEVDNVSVRYGMTRVVFDDVLRIGSVTGEKFCHYGDSGALVYAVTTFQPVGLLFATSLVGGPHDVGWTWAHPIRHVTEALQVDLVNR